MFVVLFWSISHGVYPDSILGSVEKTPQDILGPIRGFLNMSINRVKDFNHSRHLRVFISEGFLSGFTSEFN